ncbi:MAG TPA: DUF4350 domain-containing protein [Bacteroidota bacterium]|nr:DUF4350 domain-containing protein [Bacteroidota bacterium]
MKVCGEDKPILFLVGDSTVAEKPVIGNPERGWGQFLPALFMPGTLVENHARNGRSTRSFLEESRWELVLGRLRPGDYVMIQFGHNDAKQDDPKRYAAPRGAYRENLLRFVRDVRSKRAYPILITPVCRRRFDSNGNFYDVHGEYPEVVREVGRREAVPVLDLHRRSFELFSRLGEEQTKELFLWVAPGVFSAIPGGKQDNTHFNSRGALAIARLVAEELRELRLPLAEHLKPIGSVTFPGIGRTVLLDNFYNNEWRANARGEAEPFHYVWHDTTNSGYSQLGAIITGLGADIDTLCRKPTDELLGRADVYVLVDPDTPKEAERPNFMSDDAADAIERWVQRGGVLAVFGNDRGNAEFAHINRLLARFGIRFNEDSRNRVIGTNYATGTFERLPDGFLFKDVRKIFLKEISTLAVRLPAEPLLTVGDDVIIAAAKIGRGVVFVVGDPWFYNEYMDNRRLPEGYDNARAAENLFRWFLSVSGRISKG